MHGIYKKYVRICKNIKIQNDIKESKDTKRRNQCQFLILIQHQMKRNQRNVHIQSSVRMKMEQQPRNQ